MRRKINGIELLIVITLIISIGLTTASKDYQKKESIIISAQWDKTYGGTEYEVAHAFMQTADGGYILTGETESFGAGDSDYWLVKTDSSGVMQWNKTFGGTNIDISTSVCQTADDGFILAGHTLSYGAGSYDVWVIKTDSAGEIQWNNTYGDWSFDRVGSIIQTADGGFALTGDTFSYSAGDRDFWLVKINASGMLEWQNNFGGIVEEIAYSLVETVDGGFALTGHTESFGAGNSDFWLLKTDSNGEQEWNKTYGDAENDIAHTLIQSSDGGFLMVGMNGSVSDINVKDCKLVKTDENGTIEWIQIFGGVGWDEAFTVIQCEDNGYAVAGNTDSQGAGGRDALLIKTDTDGMIEWNQTFGGTDDDGAESLVQTVNGDFTLCGYTKSTGAGGKDFWLFNVEISETTTTTSISTATSSSGSITPSFEFEEVILLIVVISVPVISRRKK